MKDFTIHPNADNSITLYYKDKEFKIIGYNHSLIIHHPEEATQVFLNDDSIEIKFMKG